MKEQNELEQLFSSAFDGFEVTPPSHVKVAIDESLFASKTPVHSKRGFIWLFPLIGFFFIGSFITLSFNTRNHSTKISNSSSTQLANQTTHSSAQERNTLNNTENQVIDTKKQHIKAISNKGEMTKEQHQFSGFNNTQKNKGEGKFTDVNYASNSIKSSKKGGLINATNQSAKKSKTQLAKRNISNQEEAAHDSYERSTVNDDATKYKVNDNFASAGKLNEDSATETTSSVNSENEAKSEGEVNVMNEDIASTNEKQKEVIISIDSSKSRIQQTQIAPLAEPSKWSVGLYAGTLLGVNLLNAKSNNNYEINSPAGFSSSIEVNYGLNSKWSFATGLGYSTFNEQITGVVYDTTYIPNGVTIQYIYLNPALQDTIIDSIVTVNYITEIASSNVAQKINFNVFSLPIYGSFTLLSKGNWNSSLQVGVRLNYYKSAVTNYYEGSSIASISDPEIKQFGVSAALRPEITYSFGKFGVGIYLNTSFDIIPITRWSEFDKKRFDLGAGVVLKYHF